MSIDENSSDEHSRSIERRTILKAAAWTVPTIVIATASPAAATASGTMTATSASGTTSGLLNRLVTFTVTFAGSFPGPHSVSFTRVTSPGDPAEAINIVTVRSIPSGGGSVQFSVTTFGDSRGKTATISFFIQGHGSGTIAAPIAR